MSEGKLTKKLLKINGNLNHKILEISNRFLLSGCRLNVCTCMLACSRRTFQLFFWFFFGFLDKFSFGKCLFLFSELSNIISQFELLWNLKDELIKKLTT
jgi:hypothetical protein